MTILVCDPLDVTSVEKMQNAGLIVEVMDRIQPDKLLATIANYDGLVVRSRTKIRAPLIDAARNLKVIVRGGVGLDNIDYEYAQSKGITVLNTAAASSNAVAELTLGYFFSLARSIPQATASLKNGLWEKNKFEGDELFGKTLGLIGLGNIGKKVANLALALGMTVIAYDPYVDSIVGIEIKILEEVISQSDYISLHLPLNNDTEGMIGTEQIDHMKTGVRIVNCARGGIIDEKALFEALSNGKIAGVALDVFSVEPSIGNPLLSLENVIGSPHIGAATREAQARIGEEVANKMIEFFNNT